MKLRFAFPLKDNTYRVIDGDTVEVVLDRGFNETKTVSLRFAGLNAPETRTRRELEKEAGLLVKDIVIKWLTDNTDKQFFCSSDEKPKFANRIIGSFWADNEENLLNSHLLTLGVVKPYNGGKRSFSDEELTSIIEAAKIFLGATGENTASV
jgi:micrococcal nuclease